MYNTLNSRCYLEKIKIIKAKNNNLKKFRLEMIFIIYTYLLLYVYECYLFIYINKCKKIYPLH